MAAVAVAAVPLQSLGPVLVVDPAKVLKVALVRVERTTHPF
jgi:hypothetical protein